MSASQTTRIGSPTEEMPAEDAPSAKHRSPVVVVGLLLLLLILLRLPSALLPRELNIDESQGLADAMKFAIDPRPWIAVQGGSWGPLNSYLVTAFLLIGFKPGFILVHMLAMALVCLQVVLGYITMRRFASEAAAAFGALLMALVYGLSTKADFSLPYAGEMLPALLLMLGFYLFLCWLDKTEVPGGNLYLGLLFLGGLVLGTAPWCKSQAAPVSGALGLLVIAAIFHDANFRRGRLGHIKQLAVFCAGAISTSLAILAVLLKTGAVGDFWASFIKGNVAYAGGASWSRVLVYFLLVFVVTPLNQLLVVGVSLVIYTTLGKQSSSLPNQRNWVKWALLVYAGASLFAVCRVQYLFPHHAIFLVPPVTYIIADLASHGLASWGEGWTSRKTAILVVAFVPALVLYSAYIVRYGHMIEAIRRISRETDASRMEVIPDLHVRSAGLLDNIVGPSDWVIPDWNERIASTVETIRQTHSVHSLMIWGLAPGVYVLTDMVPATRYSVAEPARSGTLQTYYTGRLMGDLRSSNPDLFIDTVCRGMRRFDMTETDGYESVPELREFVDKNYTLVATLPVIKGSKPVRFFLRRSPAAAHDASGSRQGH